MKYLKEGSHGRTTYTAIAKIDVNVADPNEGGQSSILCTFAAGQGALCIVGDEMCIAFLSDLESPSSNVIDFTQETLRAGSHTSYVERYDRDGNSVDYCIWRN